MKSILCIFLFVLLAFPKVGIGQSVTFSTTRGFYDTPFQLTLSTSLAGGTIRYTTDGSAPTAVVGTVYAGSIAVATTSVVRALAYSGAATTPVATHSYFFLNDVMQQPKNIAGWPNNTYPVGAGTATAVHDYEMDPNVVNDPAYSGQVRAGLLSIPTMSLVLSKADFWDLYDGETKHPTSVEMLYPDGTREQFDCSLEPHSHDRLKRSMSLSFATTATTNLFRKAPFNTATVANTFKDTKIVLRAGNNRSWARNWNPDRTAYTRDEWYRQTQQAISGVGGRGTFVHLYVNGLYWGLYNPAERTDAGMLANYYGGSYADWMALDPDGIRSGDATRFNYLTTTLINQDLSVPANYAQLKQYLDVSRFCDYLIVTWITGMTDWPGNNFQGGNRNVPPSPFWYNTWDCEWSWDTTNGSNLGAWVHPEFLNNTTGTSTLAKIWHAARRNPDFMQLFADRVYRSCFNTGGLTDAASRARWAAVNSYISTAIVDESARWGDALADGTTRTKNGHWTPEVNRVDGLMNGNVSRFIAALTAQGYYPSLAPPTFSQEGGAVAPGFQLTIANPNAGGTTYYTTDGTDPEAAGGAVAAGAVAYTGPVAISGSVSVKARVRSGSAWSPLHESPFTISGQIAGLFINEFMASNTKLADEFGEFDDWIEIYNSGTQPVNIGGLYVTDLLTNLTKFQIPTTNSALTTIPAKGYLLLWADSQPAQGPLHLNLSLSKSGEAIGLSQMIGTTPTALDSYTFGAQADDVSTGRFPDGSPTFRTFTAATPGSANVINFKSGLFINELMAVNQTSVTDPAGEHDPWIEVYNNNPTPVDIGGLYLTNTLGNPAFYRIPTTSPALTTIPAKSHLLLWADNQPAQGVLHAGFALNAGGGQIGLADIVGPDVSIIDSTRYGAQVADVSRGRYPDASAQFKAFASPTPGATNTVPAITGIFINEFMASNTKLADEFGEFDDWIELYNAGNQPVDVGGLYLTDALTNPGKFQIPTTNPALTTIPAKGFLLLWADDQAVAQGVLHVGFKLSASGEQIGLYQPNGTTVTALDTYTFGAQAADVSMGRVQDGAATFVSFAVPTPNASNNGSSTNAPPVANAGPNQTITLPTNSVVLSGSGTDDGTITAYAWTQLSGPNTATLSGAATATLTASGLAAGSYVFRLTVTDNGNATGTAQATITVNPAVSTGPQVVSFTLVNASTGADIQPLTAGATLNLATLPSTSLNVRANPGPAPVGSVVLALSGAQTQNQTESVAPYALFGDNGAGTYNPWTPAVGSYTLLATPYSAASGGGTAGTPLSLSFSVVNQTATGPFTLATSTVGTGTVTKSPNTATYASGSTVSLTATAGAGFTFTGWSGDATGTANPLSVTMNANKNITATFTAITPTSYTLAVSSVGTGTVTKNPDAASYASGTSVTLTATAGAGYQFSGWSGDATGSTNPLSVTMNGNKSITATFTALPAGQSVMSYTLINADTNTDIQTLTSGATLNLSALPTSRLNIRANTNPATVGSVVLALSGTQTQNQTESGAPYALFGDNGAGVYNSWTPAVGSYNLTARPYTAASGGGTAGTPLAITFTVTTGSTPTTYTLATSTVGTGTVTKSPNAATYASGSTVSLTATAGAGYQFSGWSGDATGTANPLAVTMNANKNITATFTAVAPATYTLTTSTVGTGTVTKSPNAATYASGSTVSLTATAGAGYTFTGWSGDATGSANPLAVTMTANKTITATFTASSGGPQLTGFVLVNASTGTDIQALTTGAALNLATLPSRNLNVRATTSPATVGSVVLTLSGAATRSQTESVAPYALFGDNGAGTYNPWTPAVGSYTLTARPYTGGGGGGTAGAALTISFSVSDQAARVTAASGSASGVALAVAYPNPSPNGHFRLLLPATFGGPVRYRLISVLGATLASGTLPAGAQAAELDFAQPLSGTSLSYLLLDDGKHTARLKLVRQ
ncbi:lamin tail domain-containing protein [Hymenobacter artigasi]|uniref:Repeat protein (TIGR02543 family) n=1 Tax=Hymenobacter artigasi TaxID=2719616 RepID=A0ABX1HEG0_9BACT|nr:lamin tail domain-containing protein [Hymenobacter artigasi]NKI88636.1 putative repeat protein (TIGR02543 family) [Hymenobacter artigasi]